MVVVCPPPSLFMPRHAVDDSSDDEPTTRYYVQLEFSGDQPSSSRNHHVVIEITDDGDTSDESEEADGDEEPSGWDPFKHIDELPLRPMSTFRKACIDVAVVVGTVVAEADLVWMALKDHSVSWFIALPGVLPLMLVFLYIAALMHLVATRQIESVGVQRVEADDQQAK